MWTGFDPVKRTPETSFKRVGICALVLLLCGCEGVSIVLPFDEPVLDATGQAYELRYKRTPGEALRYQATYRIRHRSEPVKGSPFALSGTDVEVDEDITADLFVYTAGKTETPQPFDRVILRRRELKRDMLEVAPNGKVTKKEDVRDLQPLVTPNFEHEPTLKGSGTVYIPMDELGCIARRKETPYHYAAYDSLCYLFPVFPKQAVRIGDIWKHSVPVIVGWEYSNNEFTLHSRFELQDVRRLKTSPGEEGPLCAVIAYKYYGLMDSSHAEDSDKLPVGSNLLRRRDVIEGEGLAYFDIRAGKVTWRKERYSIAIEREFERTFRSGDKKGPPKRERLSSRTTVEFACRLLGPGERGSDRPSRM